MASLRSAPAQPKHADMAAADQVVERFRGDAHRQPDAISRLQLWS